MLTPLNEAASFSIFSLKPQTPQMPRAEARMKSSSETEKTVTYPPESKSQEPSGKEMGREMFQHSPSAVSRSVRCRGVELSAMKLLS